VDCRAGLITVDDVIRVFASYTEAIVRILGARPGSLVLADPETLRSWFS
jgi:hypothetical protein